MIKVLYEAFCQALIRFFNNRFIQSDKESYYRMELDKLRQRNEALEDRLLEILSPRKSVEILSESNELMPAVQPVETFFQKRQRLEKESQALWMQQLADAQKRIEAEKIVKSTSELESAVLGVANGSTN